MRHRENIWISGAMSFILLKMMSFMLLKMTSIILVNSNRNSFFSRDYKNGL